MSETLAERLAAFALSTRFEDLPDAVVTEARRRLLDAFACAVGALGEPAPTFARRVAAAQQGTPGGALIGGGRSTADWAAFANGVHIRYLDCNDTYLSLEPAHPSDNWAAVMAAGEHAGATGKDWISAAAVAYEIQCRLCDAASIRARGWDHTTYGSLSTSLAAAKLFGLSHEQAVHALGIAGTTGTALRLTRAGELSMWKGCAFAFAARNGVFAALLAREGMTGPAPLFEGDMGFIQQVSGPLPLSQLGGPKAADWMLPKTSIKFWPAEYHSQSAIAAALELRPQIANIASIRSIEIATFRTAVEIIGQDPEKWHPKTRETADHSLPYCTAVALVDGDVSTRQFEPARLADPALLDLVKRTVVVEDANLTAEYPAAIPNRVRVTLSDGRTLQSTVRHPPGHDKNPLSDAQLRQKFDGLVVPVLGPDRAQEIWERVSRIEDDPKPHEAIALLTSP
ncbi:MAG: MmgE/PrpD family protein [Isosphaeraceae bacterium]|nr:MmgE/PrpD family protein [Isosphaeraceae bacterium]